MITVTQDGDDITYSTTASTFSGPDDHEDSGIGAGGWDNNAHPSFLGVSLPMRCRITSLLKSPIPHVEIRNASGSVEGARVRVWSPKTNVSVICHVTDIGPTGTLNRGIDLTPAVAKALGLDIDEGLWPVRVRIFDAKAII